MHNLNYQLPGKLSDQRLQNLSYDKIDEMIVFEIDKATSEDSKIWTCPDFNRREYLHCFFQYPAMMVPLNAGL